MVSLMRSFEFAFKETIIRPFSIRDSKFGRYYFDEIINPFFLLDS